MVVSSYRIFDRLSWCKVGSYRMLAVAGCRAAPTAHTRASESVLLTLVYGGCHMLMASLWEFRFSGFYIWMAPTRPLNLCAWHR